MVIYYLDTSALGKRYVSETGSVWLRDLLAPAHQAVVVTTQLSPGARHSRSDGHLG